MLDISLLRGEKLEITAQALQRRGYALDTDRLQKLDSRRRELQTEDEGIRHQRNVSAKEIGQAKARGEDIVPLNAKVAHFGSRLSAIKAELDGVRAEFRELLLEIPNIPDERAPSGEDERSNLVLKTWGAPPHFDFPPIDHVSLGGSRLDAEMAARIVGSRFTVLRGPLARLARALGHFMLDMHTLEHGYEEVQIPLIVNQDSLIGTGQLPKFAEDLFRLQAEEGYYLIPTSEVSVTNMMRDQILNAQDLPLKFVCQSQCFRSEAGSYGKDTRGMIRQRQFEKVELVQIVHPSDSWNTLEELTKHAEAVLERLELPYRRVDLCTGDLGFTAARTYDLEVWLPSQGMYREISSCSNFLDFQARRLQSRWRKKQGAKPEYAHTLNGSALAIGRTVVAIMENYQTSEGRIRVPGVLIKYMDGITEI